MNRRIGLVLVFLGFLPAVAFSQGYGYGYGLNNQGALMGGLGMTVIDDTTYITLSFRPELAFGKWGLGLDIPLRFNTTTGDIRGQDWNEGYDYLRIVRYLRYGRKRQPLYMRLGALDAARIGHGFIMNFYNNDFIHYDRRKVGLALDVDAGIAGFESMTNNLGRAEIFGGRLYYRPLFETGVPVIRNFAVGATYVTDIDPDEDRDTADEIAAFGLDIELPVIKTSLLQTILYADYAKISRYGHGTAAGIELSLSGIGGTFDFVAQLERRFLSDEFLPAYFNFFYEFDKFRVDNGVEFRKENLLKTQRKTNGTFGLLYGSLLNTLTITGTFERLDAVPNSGILYIQAHIPDAVPKISARASYTRTGIDTFGDAFELDERSVARLGIGYKVYPFMIFYMDYIWTYRFNETANKYEIQKRFEPQIAFVYPFPIGGGGR